MIDNPKTLFGKAINGIFGPSTPLTNEPTIDYNTTIPSYRHDDFSLHNNKPRDLFGDIEDESDDELNNDLNMVYNQFTQNNTRLSDSLRSLHSIPDNYPGKFRPYDDDISRPIEPSIGYNRQSVNEPPFIPDRFSNNSDVFLSSGPRNYKNRYTPRQSDSYKRYTNEDRLNKLYGLHDDSYKQGPLPYDHLPYEPLNVSNRSLPNRSLPNRSLPNGPLPNGPLPNGPLSDRPLSNRPYSDRPYSDRPFSDRPDIPLTDISNRPYNGVFNKYNPSEVTRKPSSFDEDLELKRLHEEVNKEINKETKYNTKFNENSFKLQLDNLKQINDVSQTINDNNKVLEHLNGLINMNQSDDVGNRDYDQLKKEYLNELINYQNFYKSYLKLFSKYKQLKKHYNDRNIAKKIKLIRETTNENSVKLMCNNLLDELN